MRQKTFWNPTICSCENVEYLAIAIDDSVIMCDEIINVVGSVSTNISANVMSAVSTNFHKKVRYKMDCYILHPISLVM